jgi:broad specificity phosphatase PhoE
MSFAKTLPRTILEKRPIAVLMRHAERHPFNPRGEEEALLTEKGHRDSYKLGKDLSALTPLQIFHSPIMRCTQTAQQLCRGLEDTDRSCKISGVIEDLGPSLFVIDWEKILASLEEQGPSFVRMWFDGKVSQDLIVPVEVSAKRGLAVLTDQLVKDRLSSILVSHDWNIMVLLEHFFKLKHEDIGYPGFLSGIVAYRENQRVSLHYGKYSCSVEVPLLR